MFTGCFDFGDFYNWCLCFPYWRHYNIASASFILHFCWNWCVSCFYSDLYILYCLVSFRYTQVSCVFLSHQNTFGSLRLIKYYQHILKLFIKRNTNIWIYLNRQRDDRDACCCCIKLPSDWEATECSKRMYLQEFMKGPYSKVILSTPGRVSYYFLFIVFYFTDLYKVYY